MYVYPVPGRRVRDPLTRAELADHGRDVDPNDPYWLRLLRDGDVTTNPNHPAETGKAAATASRAPKE